MKDSFRLKPTAITHCNFRASPTPSHPGQTLGQARLSDSLNRSCQDILWTVEAGPIASKSHQKMQFQVQGTFFELPNLKPELQYTKNTFTNSGTTAAGPLESCGVIHVGGKTQRFLNPWRNTIYNYEAWTTSRITLRPQVTNKRGRKGRTQYTTLEKKPLALNYGYLWAGKSVGRSLEQEAGPPKVKKQRMSADRKLAADHWIVRIGGIRGNQLPAEKEALSEEKLEIHGIDGDGLRNDTLLVSQREKIIRFPRVQPLGLVVLDLLSWQNSAMLSLMNTLTKEETLYNWVIH
ncbi:hypothetical protein FB45DRAFT_875824 [Roridomyces roridus]|uniref:Uncharacterized protein n=1 Tax=Roridomyces roridus TaxID=1738132 RepID=A0AAD7B5T3_9AGAR|nr:hypothetical protein FB45DRAFT_875824 [Roridomyces roridus]